ncbi:ferric iron reductase [Streptomyces mangrovisoli]|uniref:Ferric iron reductase n=1 Tax=Streptomyces mangrovisoli TaxID=1428628 RepID=A0A1J4NXT5_9ACTN|nr:ferric iron reductase [Streptomyces mangrovisoli]
MDLDPHLPALNALGGFFVLRTAVAPGPPPPAAGRRRKIGSWDVYGDLMIFRVDTVAARLGTPEVRVAASIAQQGFAARLWSVALGCAALYGAVPDLGPALLRWDPAAAAPDDLLLTEVRPGPGDAPALADAVLHTYLEPLAALLHDRCGVATGLLRGNAGSALAGAARELARRAPAIGRPDAVPRAAALAGELLAHPLLAPTGVRTATGFRRRSCCLYYRVPGGGLCGDCCFVRPPRSSPRAASG